MKLSVIAFEAQSGETVEEQTINCIDQLNEFVSNNSYTLANIISLNFFLSAGNNSEYKEQLKNINDCLSAHFKTHIPIAYLAQAPADRKYVSIEAHYIPNLKRAEVISKSLEGVNYLVIKNSSEEKLLIANGIRVDNEINNIENDSEWVFNIMEKILQSEGLNFRNIFRQWNYIEGIISVELSKNIESQHYQLFNNVRSKYYSKAEFKNGYPAATGIGTKAGGVIVSFYAASEKGLNIKAVENPLQKAAFDYTEEVLIGDTEYQGFCKSTPKFVRAKFVENAESKQVYISGTASIRDEKTIAENDVKQQTEITIDNIEKLISRETLSSIDQNLTILPKIKFFRVYIKNQVDFQLVKETCENRWPQISSIYVVSDICRDSLLVEIEALASV